jgi:hypothetical protein
VLNNPCSMPGQNDMCFHVMVEAQMWPSYNDTCRQFASTQWDSCICGVSGEVPDRGSPVNGCMVTTCWTSFMAMFTAHWIASFVLHVSMMVTSHLFQQSVKPVDVKFITCSLATNFSASQQRKLKWHTC